MATTISKTMPSNNVSSIMGLSNITQGRPVMYRESAG
jgi:hypothetical protein